MVNEPCQEPYLDTKGSLERGRILKISRWFSVWGKVDLAAHFSLGEGRATVEWRRPLFGEAT